MNKRLVDTIGIKREMFQRAVKRSKIKVIILELRFSRPVRIIWQLYINDVIINTRDIASVKG